MSVMPGACVRRARLHAADGSPIPTKHTSSFPKHRAAATVINSSGVYFISCDSRGVRGEGFRTAAYDMFVDPCAERLAVAGDGIPGKIERIVPLIVSVRIRRKRSARDDGDGP